jgi:16S rRNA (guanine966-N2)-methyltransferase
MSDIRILAGMCKGTKLSTLEGDNTRPTTGRITENIFNILSHNDYVKNFSFKKQKVLDIFAGSGRLGLEALSRGAEYTVFMDNHPISGKVIQDNIKKCKMTHQSQFLNYNAINFNQSCIHAPFSLIFCDAPYGKNLSTHVIKHLIAQKWIADNGLLCIETENTYTIEAIPHITLVDTREYGISRIHFLKYEHLF